MPHAIRIHEYGEPDVMKWDEIPLQELGRVRRVCGKPRWG